MNPGELVVVRGLERSGRGCQLLHSHGRSRADYALVNWFSEDRDYRNRLSAVNERKLDHIHPASVLRCGSVMHPCPLCHSDGCELYHSQPARRWFRCPVCALVHLDPALRLSPDDERARYSHHENDPDDPRYVEFLSRLADPLVRRLKRGAHGLDFGCGPSPVLAGMLTEAGFPCDAYDPFFFPDEDLLSKQYDFVACSEVVEHAYDPAGMFTLFGRLLAGDGVLGVMTRFYDIDAPFSEWWYRRDPTHVCFYSETTMQWIAAHHGWSLDVPRQDVTLFTLPRTADHGRDMLHR